jgi:uncharacterized membrane protein YfcA
MNPIQLIILLGVPGVLIGATVSAIFPRRRLLAGLTVLTAIALWLGIKHAPDGPDDDDPAILLALAMLTNFIGWLAGIALGLVTARIRRHA